MAGSLAFLDGGGEMGRRLRNHDWSGSPLDPPEGWPQSLRSVVGLLLNSQFPMFTAWGPELGFLYNDAYIPVLGDKHPAAAGRPFKEIWREIWGDIGPLVDRALAGEATFRENLPLLMKRRGFDEPTWFTFSYSPVRDESGAVAGMYCACTETTAQVLSERSRVAEIDRLRRLFHEAPGFMCVLRGPDHVFEIVNSAYLQLVGHRGIVGKAAREALPDIAGQGFFELLDQVYRTGEAFIGQQLQVTVQREPGGAPEARFVDLVYQPIADADGQVTGIFVEGSDVTDSVQAVQALRASEERLRDVADAVPMLISYIDADQRFRFANRPYREWFQRPLEETLGRRVSDVMAPAAYEARRPNIERALAGEMVRYEIDMPLPGRVVHTEVTHVPHRDEAGQVVGVYSVVQDITARKEIEHRLRELNETLEKRVEERTAERDRIWQNSNELMAVFDFDGRRRAINPAWTRVLGFDEATLLATPFVDITHPDDREGLAEQVRQLASGRLVPRFEDRLRHADGSYRVISWTGVPGDGVFYAIGRDVTEQRATEDALRQAHKMEAVGQLTGGIAHDFNNLLQGIVGSLDIVQKRVSQGRTGDLDRFITGAMTSANRAAALTHRLLAFSRRQPLNPKPVKVNPLVASMEDLLRRTMGERIDVALVLAGGLWTTLCDPNQLESAVLNLAINARDAMPEGGKLTIETCNARLDQAYAARFSDVKPGQYVCVSVTDTGTGMTQEVADRAFEPFFTTKPMGLGTGLGLSMIYGFARQSEGHARIYSEAGRGTTVKLYLPRHGDEAPADEEHAPAPEPQPGGDGEIVLVVEDDVVVRGLILDVLTELGYAALEAGDGPAGLRILESDSRIDLLITDIGLPGLNGRQLADAARLKRPSLKVLFMTGYAESAALAGGFLEPGMEMMTKPFPMDILAGRIRGMIEQS